MSNKKKLEQAYTKTHTFLCRLEADINNARHMQPIRDKAILDDIWARSMRREIVALTKLISQAMGYERPAMRQNARIVDLRELREAARHD